MPGGSLTSALRRNDRALLRILKSVHLRFLQSRQLPFSFFYSSAILVFESSAESC
jgi:hypothetical protein